MNADLCGMLADDTLMFRASYHATAQPILPSPQHEQYQSGLAVICYQLKITRAEKGDNSS